MLVIALAMILIPTAALASGRDVLDDLQDNGQIDACYTEREYAQALRLLSPDDAQYGQNVDVIQQARVTNVVANAGDPCPPPEAASGNGDDGGDSSALIWIGVAALVGAVAIGTGAWVRRRRSGGDGPGGDA